MYIENLPDGRFRCHIRIGDRRKSKIHNTEIEAKRWGKRTELTLSDEPDASDHTFADAVEKYRAEVTPKKESAQWEQRLLDTFINYFGHEVKLCDIKQPQIGKWRDYRLETVSGSTVLRHRKVLANIFTYAIDEWHWIKDHPFKGVKMPKENDARESLWDWKRIRSVLRYLGYRHNRKPETDYQQVALAFMIGLHTSLRASEVLRVSKDTLNDKTRVISVKTKTMKTAHVPITRRALKVCKLADFTINASDLDALFRKARDGTLAGDYTFHDSRAFALTMLARKVDILTLSKISMHKDLKNLQRYYRETPQQIAGRLK